MAKKKGTLDISKWKVKMGKGQGYIGEKRLPIGNDIRLIQHLSHGQKVTGTVRAVKGSNIDMFFLDKVPFEKTGTARGPRRK